jgi:hypothetical protein
VDKRSRGARKAALSKIIKAVGKHLADGRRLYFAGVTYTAASLARAFRAELDSITAVETAEARRRDARLAERTAFKDNRILHRALGLILPATLDAVALADFGLRPAKVGYKTVDVRERAVAKAKATRAARRTMGPKQRGRVKG